MAFYKCARIYVTENSNTEINTASGPIANFNTLLATPLLSLKANFKATQDLHGQSGPYPAGGSAQKWDEETVNGYLSSTDGSFISHITSICSKNFNPILPSTNYYMYKGSSVPTSYIYWYDSNQDFISRDPLANLVVTTPNNATYFKVSCYGYGATYKNDISINYPSTDTAYHPYSNICPISGFTGVKIGYVDFNQFVDNGNFESVDYWTGYNGTLAANDNVMSYVVTTVKNSNLNRVASTGVKSYPLPIVLGHKYFISFSIKTPYNQGTSFQSYITNPTVGDSHQGIRMTSLDTVANTWTRYCRVGIGEGTGYGDIRLGVHSSNETAIGDTSYLKNVIFIDLTQAFGSTIADYLYSLSDNGLSIIKQIFTKDYYAYNEGGSLVTVDSVNNEQTCPNASVSWQTEAGEVFGGYYDFTTGKLVVTHGSKTFSGGSDEAWSVYAAGNGYYINIPEMKSGNNLPSMSNLFPQYSGVDDLGLRYGFNNSYAYCYQANTITGVSDLTSWKAWLANNTLVMVYELAEPFTIALPDGESIKSFAGINNIYADTGDTTVEYRNLTQGG